MFLFQQKLKHDFFFNDQPFQQIYSFMSLSNDLKLKFKKFQVKKRKTMK